MLLKCCTQYARKFGKLSSGHKTGKGQFLFQSQKRAMPKNKIQTTVLLHSFHILLKPSLKDFEHYFASMWNEQLYGSLNILWHCPSLGLEWKLTFSSPVATTEFSKFAGILSAALSQHHLLGFEIAQLEFHYLQFSSSFVQFKPALNVLLMKMKILT